MISIGSIITALLSNFTMQSSRETRKRTEAGVKSSGFPFSCSCHIYTRPENTDFRIFLYTLLIYRLKKIRSGVRRKKWHAAESFCLALSLCRYECGPSRAAYLPPSLHYSHHCVKWRQTGIDSVWVHRPTAFTRRGLQLQHLHISLATFLHLDPIFSSLSILAIDSDQNLINCFIMELLTSCLSGCSFPKRSWRIGRLHTLSDLTRLP